MAVEGGGGGGIPKVRLSSGEEMAVVGMGVAEFPLDEAKVRSAAAAALEVGYRHFDTAALYGSERALGEAVADAVRRGAVGSRADVFITSKLWCTDAQPHLVLPALRTTLSNLQMDYVDLYLIHWPLSAKPGRPVFPMKKADVLPMDLKGVWEAMEECQRLGLAKTIGVSNFTTKMIEDLLKTAKIPPAVDQVEMNPVWQQQKLMQFCAEKGIHVTAFSPLGGQMNLGSGNPVMGSEVLKEIADARGKTVAQVSLRWIYEQGASMAVKSFNKERLKQNTEIFDWELTEEERIKISQIPQRKAVTVELLFSEEDNSESSVDLSDINIVEM